MESIPLNRILKKYDDALSQNNFDEAERLLQYWKKESLSLIDNVGTAAVLNELISFYRVTNSIDKSIISVQEALMFLQGNIVENELKASVYLNSAISVKETGRVGEALPLFEYSKTLYESFCSQDAFNLANVYNNYATAYAELSQFKKAEELYCKAAEILIKRNDHRCELAITYINIAQLIYKIDSNDQRIISYLDLCKKVLTSDIPNDLHLVETLEICAPIFGYFGLYFDQKELESIAKEIKRKG